MQKPSVIYNLRRCFASSKHFSRLPMLVIYLVVSWFIGLWLASVYAVGLTAVYPPAATALLIAIVSGRWPRLRQASSATKIVSSAETPVGQAPMPP